MNGNKEDLFTDHGAPPAYGLSDGGSASASTGPATFGSVTSTKFGCVALSLTDRIRLINIPTDVVTEVEKAVRGAWRKGIQQTRRYGSSYEIKLHGRPWSYSRMSDHMIEPRRLVTRVLQTLFDKGWVMKASVDVSQKERDKDSMLFRQQWPPPAPRSWLSASFYGGDKMILIDGDSALYQSMIQALGSRVQRHTSIGNNAYEFKFVGYPWRASGEETVQMRIMLITLLEVLETHGYSLYTSVAIDAGPGGEHSSSCDAWVCCRDLGWQPGTPVYHS